MFLYEHRVTGVEIIFRPLTWALFPCPGRLALRYQALPGRWLSPSSAGCRRYRNYFDGCGETPRR